ncbi:MAG: AAA family ATPase [Thermoplasmata archaeon]
MLLKKLYLENFVSHKSTELEFSKGITVITGKNGAGKTSILDSLLFCLFKESRTGNLKDLIHLNSTDAKSYLIFEEGLKDYESSWELDQKKGVKSAILKQVSGPILAEGPNNVKQEIEKILGMSKEIAISSIFIKQGEIDALINKKPAERKELIGKLIGLDRLESAWSDFKVLFEKFDQTISGLEVDLKSYPEIENNIKEIDFQLRALDLEKLKTNENIESKTAELNKISQDLDSFSSLKEERNRLEAEKTHYLRDMDRVTKEIIEAKENLEKLDEKNREIEDLEKEVKYLEPVTEYLKLKDRLEDAKKEQEKIEKEIRKIELQKKYCEDHISEYEQYEHVLKENDDTQKQIKNLKPDHDNYLILKEKVGHFESDLKNLKRKLTEYQNQVLSIFGVSELNDNDKSELLEKLETEKNAYDDQIRELYGSISAQKNHIRYLEDSKQNLTNAKQCPVCKSNLDAEHILNINNEIDNDISTTAQLIKVQENNIKRLNEHLNSLKTQIAKVNKFENSGYFSLKKEFEEHSNMINSLNIKIKDISDRFSEFEILEKKKAENDKLLAQLKNVHENYITANAKIENYTLKLKEREHYSNIAEETAARMSELEKYIPFEITPSKKSELDEKKMKMQEFKGMVRESQGYSERLKRKNEELENIKSAYSKILETLKQNAFNPDHYAELEGKRVNIAKSLESLKEEYYQISAMIKSNSDDREKLRKKIEELSQKQKILDKYRKFRAILEEVRKSYSKDGIQRALRTAYASIIENFVKDYVEKFNLDIIDLSIDSDFNITLRNRSGNISIDELSGGEKVAIGIALRLAIARALSKKISTIVLDEPTTYLDEDRRGELANILKDSISEVSSMIPQMIIVTHHEELVEVANTHYEVIKTNGYSSLNLVY